MALHGVCPSLELETFHWFAEGSLSDRQTPAQGTRKQGVSVLRLSEQVHNSEIAEVTHLLAALPSGLWKVKFARRKNRRYRLTGCSRVRGGLQPSYCTFPNFPN